MTDHAGNDLLSAYLDNELGDDDARRLERHLQSCPECSAALSSLAAVAGRLRSLPSVEPTADEHRELRKAILGARPAGRGLGARPLQWGLAGGFVLALVAAIGFMIMSDPSPEQATEAALDAAGEAERNTAAPQSANQVDEAGEADSIPPVEAARDDGLPNLATAAEVERFVRSLPEVEVARRSRTGSGGGGAAGGTSAYAGAAAPESLDGSAALQDPAQEEAARMEPPAGAAPSCRERLAALQTSPVDLLAERTVSYREQPARLFAFGVAGDSGYAQVLTIIVGDEGCAARTDTALQDAVLYRSTTAL